MATQNFNFSTIQPSQLNWDEDININWNDLDFLLDASFYHPKTLLSVYDAYYNNLQQFDLVRVSDKLYAIPNFEETDNIIPEALRFAPPTWTYSGLVEAKEFDSYMQSKKVIFHDSSAYISADFTTTDATTYTCSFCGNATVEIYDGATLVETITSSPQTINLNTNYTYTVKISGENKWIAHLQIEPKDYATYFSTKEWKRYSQSIKWNFDEVKKRCINVLFSLYTGKSGEWGRLLWTDSFEVFLSDTQDTLYLTDGINTIQTSVNLETGKVYLLSIITTNNKIKVYLNKVLVLEMESDVNVGEVGFFNGCFNGFIFGLSVDDYVGREILACPLLQSNGMKRIFIPLLIPDSKQTGLPADSTGIKYTSNFKFKVSKRNLCNVLLRASWSSSESDSQITIEVFNVATDNVVASVSGNAGTDVESNNFVIGNLFEDNLVSVRAKVDTASSTSGATFNIDYIVVELIYR